MTNKKVRYKIGDERPPKPDARQYRPGTQKDTNDVDAMIENDERHCIRNRPLFNAIRDNEEEKALTLCNQYIKRGGKIKEVRNYSSRTPLHCAAAKGYVRLAALFLENGVDPDLEDDSAQTALDLVSETKTADAMGALLVKHMSNESVKQLSDKTFQRILHVDFERTLLAFLDKCLVKDEIGRYSVNVEPLDKSSPDGTSKDCTDQQNENTVFQFLVREKRKTVMCHPVLRTIIDRQWKRWARKRFAFYFGLYSFGLFCFTTSILMSANKDDVMDYSAGNEFRLIFEVISVLYAIVTFTTELRQIIHHRLQYLRQIENYPEFSASALVLVALTLRLVGSEAHWYPLAVGYLLWVMRIFKYTSVFSGIGTYVEAMKHILVYDFTEFASVFAIILLAFSGSYVIVARGDGTYMTSADMPTFWAAMFVGFRTMIENQPVVEYADNDVYKPAAETVLILFMFLTMLVMLNILIAKLSNTYTEFQVDAKKNLIIRRANMIVRAERDNYVNKCSCFGKLLPYFLSTPALRDGIIRYVDLARLEPRLTSSNSLEPSINSIVDRQVKISLEIETIKFRQTKFITETKQLIEEVNDSVRGVKTMLNEMLMKKAPN